MGRIIAVMMSLSAIFSSLSYAQNEQQPRKKSFYRNQNQYSRATSNSSGDVSSSSRYIYEKSILRNRLYVDSAYLLNGGAGAGYEFSVTDHITVGPFINFFTLGKGNSDNRNSAIEFENRMRQFGLKGRFFFTGTSAEKGVYAIGAVTQVQAETKAEYLNITSSYTNEETTGYLAGLGFQFDMVESTSTKFILNLAGVYGTGYKVESTATGSLFFPTQVQKVEIQEDLYFELSIGMLF